MRKATIGLLALAFTLAAVGPALAQDPAPAAQNQNTETKNLRKEIVRLKYVRADQIGVILNSYTSREGHVQYQNNLPFVLSVIDTPENVEKILAAIREIDVKPSIAHFRDPEEFMGRFMLPTVAYNDPKYDSQTMWRGPVWANINYFFIEALQGIGRYELASMLREQTLELISSQPGISEYYDSQTGIAPPRAIRAFGWTAAVFIELAIQASRQKPEREKHTHHDER